MKVPINIVDLARGTSCPDASGPNLEIAKTIGTANPTIARRGRGIIAITFQSRLRTPSSARMTPSMRSIKPEVARDVLKLWVGAYITAPAIADPMIGPMPIALLRALPKPPDGGCETAATSCGTDEVIIRRSLRALRSSRQWPVLVAGLRPLELHLRAVPVSRN